jgi:hypothetical protein
LATIVVHPTARSALSAATTTPTASHSCVDHSAITVTAPGPAGTRTVAATRTPSSEHSAHGERANTRSISVLDQSSDFFSFQKSFDANALLWKPGAARVKRTAVRLVITIFRL